MCSSRCEVCPEALGRASLVDPFRSRARTKPATRALSGVASVLVNAVLVHVEVNALLALYAFGCLLEDSLVRAVVAVLVGPEERRRRSILLHDLGSGHSTLAY